VAVAYYQSIGEGGRIHSNNSAQISFYCVVLSNQVYHFSIPLFIVKYPTDIVLVYNV
jgi:hypothetical protein